MAEKVIRITKAQRFEDIRAMLQGETPIYGTDEQTAIEVINHELELLSKKNSSGSKKQTENQKKNEEIKEEVLEYLASLDEDSLGVACNDILKAKGWFELYSTSKLSSLLSQLRKEGKVTTQTVKGRTLFSLA